MITFFYSENYLKIILALCTSILGFALFNEHVLHVPACKLCHYQQALYALSIIILLLNLTAKVITTRHLIIILSLIFLINLSIAGYQVLLEQNIIELPSLCKKPEIKASSIEELRTHFQQMKHVPCNEVKWSLWGISMAGYNVLINSLLIVMNIMFYQQKARQVS